MHIKGELSSTVNMILRSELFGQKKIYKTGMFAVVSSLKIS